MIQVVETADLAETVEAKWWRDLLACPNCRANLDDPALCRKCGMGFSDVHGVPRLMNEAIEVEFQVQFSARRSFMSEHDLLQYLKAPPIDDRARRLPYHLDARHASMLLTLPAGSRVLEIGCGGAQSRKWYEELGLRYVGTDISTERVFEWLQAYGGADVLCDAHFLPFADDSFDAVYCAAVFEHLACPMLAAREAYRVLKPGGIFLGNASFMEPWHDHSYFHLSPLGAVELLIGSGFEPRNIWPGMSASGDPYLGYKALAMALRSPPFRLLGNAAKAAYQLEQKFLRFARSVSGRPERPAILATATIAGAIDWIATKPAG